MDDSGLCATTSFVQSWNEVFGRSLISYIYSTPLAVSRSFLLVNPNQGERQSNIFYSYSYHMTEILQGPL